MDLCLGGSAGQAGLDFVWRAGGRRRAAGKVTHDAFRVSASVELTRAGLMPGSAQPPFYGSGMLRAACVIASCK